MFKLYLLPFLIAFLIAFLLTPVVRLISLKMGWLDKPDWRKINKCPMPLAGGMAIYAGFVIALLFLIHTGPSALNRDKLWGLLGSAFIIFLVGIADDIQELTPRRKLFYQTVVAIIAYLSGYAIIRITGPLGGHFNVPVLISIGLTVFWIVGFTNAVNLLDGLDGLAAGIVVIISGSLFFTAMRQDNPNTIVAILSVCLAGSSLGFLPNNFYPAKIFMGDTGSMFLGFVISLISIEGTYKGSTFVTFFVPVIAMGVPVIDTGLSILRRLVKGNGIFKPDREHIHHKLLLQEGSQRKAVVKLYLLTLFFGFVAIGLSGMRGVWAFWGIILTVVATLRMLINLGFLDFGKEMLSGSGQEILIKK